VQNTSLGSAFFESFNNSFARDQVAVHQVRPISDLIYTASVLMLYGLANVSELSIFED
jgi:hypothetical protein